MKNRTTFYVCVSIAMCVAGCAPKENPEAVPNADPVQTKAKVDKIYSDNIERVKNNPKMTAEEKERALKYMNMGRPGGDGAPIPGANPPNAPK